MLKRMLVLSTIVFCGTGNIFFLEIIVCLAEVKFDKILFDKIFVYRGMTVKRRKK